MIVALASLAVAQTALNGFDLSYHGQGQTIESKDGKIYYETVGEGPILMVVAGGPGGSHTSFHGFFERLAKNYKLVLFDNIGRGRSDRLKDPRKYTVERDADDIEALRQHFGVDKIRLIGHSYGGMPVIAYSVKYGAHLGKAVLSDTLHSGKAFQENIDSCNFNSKNQFPEAWDKLMAMRKRGVKSSDGAYGDVYGTGLNELYWFDESNGAKMFRSSVPGFDYSGDVYRAMLGDDPEWVVGGTMKKFDARRAMTRVQAPILVCVGRYDRVATPKVAFEISKAYPHGTLKVFERSGHRPWVEETEAYFTAVEAFLK